MVTAPESFPFMVIGNKADLEETERAINADEAETYCSSNGKMDFLETSAQ